MRLPRSLAALAPFALTFLPAAWLALQHGEAAAAIARPRPAPSATQLVIDKTPVGTLRSAAGGSAVGTVVAQSSGADGTVKKHIGAVTYEPLELGLDLTLDRSLYEWIDATWAGKAPRKSGTLTSLDPSGKAGTTREFHNALISETLLPTLDAASKEPAFFTLLLAPERVTSAPSSGAKAGAGAAKGKAWLASNFRLEITNLDTSRVSRIEGLRVQQTLTSAAGGAREPGKRATAVQLDNFRVTLAEAGADSWHEWHQSFVVRGESDEKSERSGLLVLLDPSRREELAHIQLSNLGIVALRPRASASGGMQWEAELYVERMRFTLGGK